MFDSAHTWFRRGAEALAATPAASLQELAEAACNAAEELTARSPEAELRQCGAGCTACCHFTVGLTAVEALHLAGAVQRHPEATELHERIRRRVAEDQALAAQAHAGSAAPQATRPRRPCALLQTDGHCAVYADRPLACRGWSSTDRNGCELEHRGLGGTPRPDGAAYHAVLGIAQELESRGAALLGADGGQPDADELRGHFELHDALHRLLEGLGQPDALRGARRPRAAGRETEASLA